MSDKEFKATHRLVDKHGMETGETVMKVGNQYFTYDAWYHFDPPETDISLRKMGWFAVSSFRR